MCREAGGKGKRGMINRIPHKQCGDLKVQVSESGEANSLEILGR